MDAGVNRPSIVLNAILLLGVMGVGPASVAQTDLTHTNKDSRAIKAASAPRDAIKGATSGDDAAYRASAGRQTGNQVLMAGFQAEQNRIASDKPVASAPTPELKQSVVNSAQKANMDLYARRGRVLGEFRADTNPGEIYEEIKKIRAAAPPAIAPVSGVVAKGNEGLAIENPHASPLKPGSAYAKSVVGAATEANAAQSENPALAGTPSKASAFGRGAVSLEQLLGAPQQQSHATLNAEVASGSTTGVAFRSVKEAQPVVRFDSRPALAKSELLQDEGSKISPIAGLFKSVRMAAADLLPSIKNSLADAKFIDVPDASMIKQTGDTQIAGKSTAAALELKPPVMQLAYSAAPTVDEALSRPAANADYAPISATRPQAKPSGGISYGMRS